MIETSETLARIEANQIRNIKDVSELCLVCKKIPELETGLNNHLHTHDKITTYVLYPTAAAMVLAALAAFAKLILHVF